MLWFFILSSCTNTPLQEDTQTIEVQQETIISQPNTDDEKLITQMTSYFDADVLAKDITIEDCTLSAGTDSRCYAITIENPVTDTDIGPFCPTNISDDASQGGIWLDNGKSYDVDGEFMKNLAEFYEDEEWQIYDQTTGDINITENLEECIAAANPNVGEEYKNYCVECMLAYLDEFPKSTYYIPVTPVDQETPSSTSGDAIGLAFNGVKFEVSAPVENILWAYTIAPFDDCWGHVNPNVGYHYHAYQSDQENCSTHYETEEHTDFIGFALDGYKIYGQDDSLTDLDSCGWHYADDLGYHYHIDGDSNEHLGCSKAEYACVDSTDSWVCDATLNTGRWDRPAGPPPWEDSERPPRR